MFTAPIIPWSLRGLAFLTTHLVYQSPQFDSSGVTYVQFIVSCVSSLVKGLVHRFYLNTCFPLPVTPIRLAFWVTYVQFTVLCVSSLVKGLVYLVYLNTVPSSFPSSRHANLLVSRFAFCLTPLL
jgi:hypothetical protein